jgi:hypothetical protein
MYVLDHITGKGYIFPFTKGKDGDPGPRGRRGQRGRRGIPGRDGFMPTITKTVAEFHADTIETACYVKIDGNETITINAGVLSRMPEQCNVTVRHCGALTITGAISPEATYEAVADGYREFSIYKDEMGETTIVVYEKPLKAC